MLILKKVAVTGGLSCGKSSVCRIFKELGAYVVSADEIVHHLLTPETRPGQQVIELIGSDIVVDHHIDRSKIAQKVFGNPNLLKSLEQILHPAVRNEIDKQYQYALQQGQATLFVVEIPLLFEAFSEGYSETIAVIAERESCIRRFRQSSGYGREEYEKRMARQFSPEEKARRATYVIPNDGSMEDLRQAVVEINNKLIQT